ncbi:MAG: alanine racemase, partial [Deltaproteobacteria bacterium]|nr:alanine racemase [Deltaproteobacteria bacterium]
MKLTVLFVLVAAGVLAFLLKPEDRGLETANAALTPLNGTARASCEGTPCAFIDLDALDANIDFVKREVGARRLRVVAKSLPSLELLAHVMERAQTKRLMVFHAPHAETLLANFKDADLLFGKPMPEEATLALVKHVGDDAARVRFLVDSRERLAGLVRVARAQKRTLRVVIELDVGLRRGGVVHDNELVALMDSLAQSPELTFAGVMG